MDTSNGDLYASRAAALSAGVPEDRIVDVSGSAEAITAVSKAVRAQSKARRKAQKKARRNNR